METIQEESPAAFSRTMRRRTRLTQTEFSRHSGVERALIARLEGGREPKLTTLRRLVASLGGRMELAARFERPLEALAEDFLRRREDAWREAEDRRWAGPQPIR